MKVTKPMLARLLAAAVLAICLIVMSGATATKGGSQPNKLIIVSTTDVKGKVSPCG